MISIIQYQIIIPGNPSWSHKCHPFFTGSPRVSAAFSRTCRTSMRSNKAATRRALLSRASCGPGGIGRSQLRVSSNILCIYIHIYTSIYICIYKYIFVYYIYMYIIIYIHMYVFVYNMYIYVIYIHVCIHNHTPFRNTALIIWAISKTLGSRKGHPQIWEGPIAYRTFVQEWYMVNLGGIACRKLLHFHIYMIHRNQRPIWVSLMWILEKYINDITLKRGIANLGRSHSLQFPSISINQCPSNTYLVLFSLAGVFAVAHMVFLNHEAIKHGIWTKYHWPLAMQTMWQMDVFPFDIPSGKHTKSYWKWPFIVDLPMENDGFPSFSVNVYQRV